LYEKYSDIEEFKNKFRRHLQLKLNSEPCFTELPKSDAESEVETAISNMPKLSQEAQTLLKKATVDEHGLIHRVENIRSVSVITNYENLLREDDPRESAIWEGAIKDLEKFGLIEDIGHKRSAFKVTREGYEIAELITL
jgi:hypothetical protein